MTKLLEQAIAKALELSKAAPGTLNNIFKQSGLKEKR